MKQIVIPNPCSEDWGLMTPTEKGAFCKKCSLEVIDFTKQSPEEIRETLTLNFGKKSVGHIEKTQLELANSNFHVWENQSPQILRSKFLYACLMVFGMSLFTGCADTDPAKDEINGGIEHVDGGMEVLTGDTIISCDIDTTKTGEIENTTEEMGKIEMKILVIHFFQTIEWISDHLI
jgi:hypothetical protein